MARIRSIKPEFWRSPSTAKASPWGRLLYVAMWGWADDHGRGEWTERELLAFAFPHDTEPPCTPAEFPRLLAEVADAFAVEFYTVRGRRYYAITSWDEHQKNERRAKSKWPSPDDPDATPDLGIHRNGPRVAEKRGSSVRTDGNTVPGTGEQGNRGTGEQTPSSAAADGAFDEFWSIAPRKVGKKDAQRKWAIAIKSADPAVIIEGMRRYAHGVTVTKTEQQFIVHPATWLHQGRWEDEDNVRPIRPAEPPSPWDTAPRYDANGRIQ